jgi:hypothetical protein
MPRNFTIYDEDKCPRLLKDGEGIRVRMNLMDAGRRRVAFTDAHGLPSGHRPGYAWATDPAIMDSADEARGSAAAEYEACVCDAWRNQPSIYSDASRTTDPAHAKIPEVEDGRLEYVRRISNAWRNPAAPADRTEAMRRQVTHERG